MTSPDYNAGGAGRGAPREYQSIQTADPVRSQQVATSNKVFANNLGFGVTEEVLKEFFTQNKVRAIKIVVLKNDNGQSKGTAIVEFSST